MVGNQNINYTEIQPKQGLVDFVKCFWYYSNQTKSAQNFTILPDGCFDLIIHLHHDQIQVISITGIWTNQIDVSIPINTTLIGVRFKLLSAEYIFQQSISTYLNSEKVKENKFWEIDTFPLDDFKETAFRLSQKLYSIIGRGLGIDDRKRRLLQLIEHSQGLLKVNEVSERICWSSRQINRYFGSQFGISLKSYSSILRCFASFRQIQSGNFYPGQNFFDQSHFIKDIKKHTGASPKELYQNKNDRFLQLVRLPKE